jgi:hypothetical protein
LNASGEKTFELFDKKDFQILASQRPTHYNRQRIGDALNIILHKNVLLTDVIVSDVLYSHHPPVIFHIQVHIIPEIFQTLMKNLQIGSGEWSASRSGRFIPMERAPRTHCITLEDKLA